MNYIGNMDATNPGVRGYGLGSRGGEVVWLPNLYFLYIYKSSGSRGLQVGMWARGCP